MASARGNGDSPRLGASSHELVRAANEGDGVAYGEIVPFGTTLRPRPDRLSGTMICSYPTDLRNRITQRGRQCQ